MSAKDAIEFLLVGAKAVSVGTGTFINPRLAMEIKAGIEDYMARHGHTGYMRLSGQRVL